MTIEIKNRITGEVIKTIEAETLREADLSGANLSGANLSGADLSKAKGTFTFNFGVKLKVVEE